MLTAKFLVLASVLPFLPRLVGRASEPADDPSVTRRTGENPAAIVGTQSVPLFSNEINEKRPVYDASETRQERVSNVVHVDFWAGVEKLKPAATRSFVRWLRSHDVSATISQRALLTYYLEYCEYANVRPLTDRSLFNKLKKAGVETFRPPATVIDGRLHRPTMYRVRNQSRRAA